MTLTGVSPARLRGGEAGEDVVEPVAVGELLEPVAVDGVEADVDPVQAGRGQRRRDPGEADGVGGQADLGARRAARSRPATMPTRPGRSSGSPPVNRTSLDAELLDADADQPDDLLVGEHLDLRQPVQALGRHAVGAAQVAAVGQRDPQVGGDAAVPVDQPAAARGRVASARRTRGRAAGSSVTARM